MRSLRCIEKTRSFVLLLVRLCTNENERMSLNLLDTDMEVSWDLPGSMMSSDRHGPWNTRVNHNV
jgi:hypothetical protein